MIEQKLPPGAPVEAELPSGRVLKMIAGRGDTIATEIAHGGIAAFESSTVEVFVRLARKSRVVLDIGAHTGVYSLIAALENPSTTVYGFEAVPAVYDLYVRNLEHNGLAGRIRPIQCALSDKDGRVTVYLPGGGTPTSASTRRGFRPAVGEVEVPAVRGDTFVDQNGITVDLIKIDTEATEPLVLGGLVKTLERDRPPIICEVLHGRTEEDLQALFAGLSYRFFHITENGPAEVPAITGDPTHRWPNYLFWPSER